MRNRSSLALASRRAPRLRACPTLAGALLAAGVSLVAADARAGGFELPDNGVRAVGRGGANAVGVSDLTAVHYNPAMLARQAKTFSLMYNHNLVFHEESFQRAPLGDSWGPDLGGRTFEKVEDDETLFPLGGFFAMGSDFGLSNPETGNLMFALSVFGPSAYGKQSWPAYGPQSWMLTETDLLLVYYSLSAAWQSPKGDFGFGATLQWVDMPNMEYELAIDADPKTAVPSDCGTLAPVANEGTCGNTPTHVLGRLTLEDRFAYTAIVGGFWRFHPNVEFAVSGRVIPVEIESKGGVKLDKPELSPEGVKVQLPLTLPMTARGGVRYFDESFDVELDVFWEGWSVIDRYDVAMQGEINAVPVHDLSIQKQWQDTVSIRAGGEYRVLPAVLDVRAGAFVENGAAPDAYSHIDFPSFDRLGLGAGLTWHALDTLDVSAGYMHVFQESRTISEADGKQFQQRPAHPCPEECTDPATGAPIPGVVANAGTFESSFDIVSLGVDFRL